MPKKKTESFLTASQLMDFYQRILKPEIYEKIEVEVGDLKQEMNRRFDDL